MSKAYLLFEMRKGDRSAVSDQKLIAAAADLDEIIKIAEKLASSRLSQRTECDVQIVEADTRNGECKMNALPISIRSEVKIVLAPQCAPDVRGAA